jgi:hypothetical protein
MQPMCIPLGPEEPSPHKPLAGPSSTPPLATNGDLTDREVEPQAVAMAASNTATTAWALLRTVVTVRDAGA